ncbi:transketolase [Toxoplasma gondii ARI]|uniref:Transketolase n=1 Tax=Toxoplasma gondii ARI TaxID=1074872 RepID=A0A139XL70_TOXGO|nr:transketolase [Toxoplasma gondii ARI]
MSAKFNKDGFPLFDNHVFVFCGDGCLEEGVSSEACSLAGHLGLHRLTVLYDDNNITIDGELHLAFSEKVQQRFKAYDWHVDVVEDGNTDVAGLVQREAATATRPRDPAHVELVLFSASESGVEGLLLLSARPCVELLLSNGSGHGEREETHRQADADLRPNHNRFPLKQGRNCESPWITPV